MPFYQCFKTVDRTVYVSSTGFRSHAEGASWVAACMQHFGIQGNAMLGKPWESPSQPDRATIWP